MQLRDIGVQAQKCWAEIPEHFPNVVLHEYVIMPNHVHGIIEIVGAKDFSPHDIVNDNSPHQMKNHDFSFNNILPNTANDDSPPMDINSEFGTRAKDFSPLRPNGTSKTVGSIIRGFKIGVTKFAGYSVWQRNYYEHIIRDYVDYAR